jgi:riboflavin synthase
MRLAIAPASGAIALEGGRNGDSVAVAGVCLTMLEPGAAGFEADVSPETLARTTLGDKAEGDEVNLELALQVGDRLGGHFVSGHIDASIGIISRRPEGESERFEFELPPGLAKYICRKGSVCLDGVSLTVNDVANGCFSIYLIPHTLASTTLGALVAGDRVNLEVDLIARYLDSLTQDTSK